MTVADVGSGTGFMAAGLAPLVSHVYVLDGSAAMLDVARSNLAGLTNVAFRQTDGAQTPPLVRQFGRSLSCTTQHREREIKPHRRAARGPR